MFGSFRQAWDVARKDILLFRSDPKGVVLSLLIPVALATLFGFIFRNGSREQLDPVRTAIVVIDNSSLAHAVAASLEKNKLLNAQIMSAEDAETALDSLRVAVVVTMPEGLGGGEIAQRPRVKHAPGTAFEGQWATGIVTETVMREAGRRWLPQIGGNSFIESLEARYGVEREVTGKTDQDRAVFGHSFCGMSLQYLLFLGMDCGLVLLRERTHGVWRRLSSSPTPQWAIIAGRALATMLIALMQISFTMGCAWLLFGVSVRGSVLGFLLVVVAISSLAATCGLLVASIGGTEGRARSISILVILALSLVGGLWLPAFLMPWWVRDLGWLLPTSWALRGLESSTWQGASFTQSATCAAVVMAYSLLFLVVATSLLTRRSTAPSSRGA
jgi:ABC-2 type transport system permease protein